MYRGLGHADLRLCQRKLPATFPATGTGGLEPGHCTFANQLAFKFSQSRKDSK
jgi:hypothetical protein